jgi:hypothetical protein
LIQEKVEAVEDMQAEVATLALEAMEEEEEVYILTETDANYERD